MLGKIMSQITKTTQSSNNITKTNQYKDSQKKVTKGVRRMPWLSEAKKDVTSCEKLRGLANTNRSADVRMGQPILIYQDIRGNLEANVGN